ncbi:MAG: M20/M25/M40 family metallo-hydrolase [Chloroflexota bacterium]
MGEALGHRPAITRWGFSTDGAVTVGEMGIPTVGFGPGAEADAHATDDKVAIADLVTAAAVYARLAADILK